MGRLRFGTARSPAATSGRSQRHSFTAHGYRQPGGPQGPPQPTSPAASTSSAVPASPPRTARGLPAPPGLAEEEAIGCQEVKTRRRGASGYHAPGCPVCGRPRRCTRQTAQALPARATTRRRRLRPLYRPDAFDPPTQSPCPPRWCQFISPRFGATIRLRGPLRHVLHTQHTTERLHASQGPHTAQTKRNTLDNHLPRRAPRITPAG